MTNPNKDKKLSFSDISELENAEMYIYQMISSDCTSLKYFQFKITLLETFDTNLKII